MKAQKEYDLVVGLEVHIQLNTRTKLFSADSTRFDAEPNSQTSVVSLAHPGTLPVLNEEAVEKAIRLGLAFNSRISQNFYFDRKHYFYPDSPLGYQITQQNTPICSGGYVSIPTVSGENEIELEKIHLESDAGKSIHDLHAKLSMIDLNRAGMPLMELVTRPVLQTIEDVGLFVAEVQRTVRFLGIGDGNMEEGSLRCDANISLKPKGSKELGQKVEIKNMNSIRHIKKALEFEVIRQTELLDNDKPIVAESRLFDSATGKTDGMRGKEEAHDYRYFPDPDISPVSISNKKLAKIESTMPALPALLRKRFQQELKISRIDTLTISDEPQMAQLMLGGLELGTAVRELVKWLIGPVKSQLNQLEKDNFKLTASKLSEVIHLVDSGQLTYRNAVESVLPDLCCNVDAKPADLMNRKGLSAQNDETELIKFIDKVLAEHPKEVEAYKNGKKALLQLFMGKVMKATRGKANPKKLMKLIKDKIG